MVLGRPQQVRVREVQRRLVVLEVAGVGQRLVAVLGRIRPHDALSRQQHVEDHLQIQTPVSRVVVDDYRVDLETFLGRCGVDGFGEGPGERRVVVFQERLAERPDFWVCRVNVPRCDDVGEAIHLCDVTAPPALAANDHDAFVAQVLLAVDELRERSVGLYEHGGVEIDIKFR